MSLLQILFTGLLAASFNSSGIYDQHVPKIGGGEYALSSSQGKKIMIITLPIQPSAAADSLLYSLDTLSAHRTATLTVIAVPAYEDGFTAQNKAGLKQWYESKLGNHIIITDGLYTRKASAAQHGLFKWLTHIDQNNAFDIDVEGAGHKFIIKENGELGSVLDPTTRLTYKAVQRALQLQ